jgi:hypothetical protein
LIVPDDSAVAGERRDRGVAQNGKRMNIFYSRVLRQFCRDFGISYSHALQGHPQEGSAGADVRHRSQG